MSQQNYFCETCEDSEEIIITVVATEAKFIIPCPECSVPVPYSTRTDSAEPVAAE